MKWVKRMAAVAAFTLVVAGAMLYYQLRVNGMIPRHDYDHAPPTLPAISRPAILVFNKTNGFIHRDAIPAADALFRDIAASLDRDIFVTDNAAVFTPDLLARFDLVIWNNVSGDVLTMEQRASLKQWIEQGGGWVGVHASGGDRSYEWSWYVDTLVGSQFVGHTMHPQFQDAELNPTQPRTAVTAHLPDRWRLQNEEWYAFADSPRARGSEILVTIDESSYTAVGESRIPFLDFVDSMEGEHPLVWRHHIGEGRALYSAIGHQAHTYRVPEYRQLLTEAIKWAIGGPSTRPAR